MSIQSTSAKCLLLICSLTIFYACHKSDQNGPQTCSIATPPATITSDMTVYYAAVDSGSVTVTSITYKDSLGADVQVASPTLPFFKAVNALSGSAIGISIEATNGVGGKISAGYQYGPPNNLISKVIGCNN